MIALFMYYLIFDISEYLLWPTKKLPRLQCFMSQFDKLIPGQELITVTYVLFVQIKNGLLARL